MPADLITLEKQLTAVNTAADLSELTAQILVNVATKTGEQAAHIRALANNSSVSGLHLASIARRGGEEDPVYARVELHRDTFEKIRNLLTEFCGTPKPEMGELIAQCQMLESRLQDLEFRHQTLMERFEGHHHTGSRRGPVNDTE